MRVLAVRGPVSVFVHFLTRPPVVVVYGSLLVSNLEPALVELVTCGAIAPGVFAACAA